MEKTQSKTLLFWISFLLNKGSNINMKFDYAMNTHHSTNVSGKGDPFASFVLGAAAASSKGISPNDT